jgi:hypothetical protein
MLTGKVDGLDREIQGGAQSVMRRAYLMKVEDINEIVTGVFEAYEQAMACEIFSHLAKSMPFDKSRDKKR